jgi:hypothetical protein
MAKTEKKVAKKKSTRTIRIKPESPGEELINFFKYYGLDMKQPCTLTNKNSRWQVIAKDGITEIFSTSNEILARGLLYFLQCGVLQKDA